MRSSIASRRPPFPVIAAIIALLLTTLYIMGLLVDWPGWLRGVNWVWVRRVPSPGWRFVLMALALLVGLGLGWVALAKGDWPRRRTALFLAALVVLTPLLQIAVAAQHRVQPLSVAVMSAAGFWHEGVRIDDPRAFLRDYPALMPDFADVHVRTQPPGQLLAHRWLAAAYERLPGAADVVGRRLHRYDCAAPQLSGLDPAQLAAGSLRIALLFLSGLGAPLLYAIGRRFCRPRAARLAAVGFAFLPGLLVFSGRMDVTFALLGLVMVWAALKAILDGRRVAAVALALLVAITSFFSFTALALAGFALLLAGACALDAPPRRDAARRWLLTAALTGAAVVLFWGALRLFFAVDGLAIWRTSQELHRYLRLEYPLWPLFNLYDLAAFMGWVPFVGALGVVGAAVVARRRGRHVPGGALALGWAAAVLLLNLSGTVRAETGRLWLFLMPVGLLVGWAYFETHFDGKAGRRRLMLLLAGFMAQSLVMGYFLGGRAPDPATSPPQFRLPATMTPLDYRLGEAITLRGYNIEATGDGTRLTLYWRAADFPRADYSVFVHALDGDGAILAQSDGPPAAVPIWCWIPGEVVADERLLAVPGIREIAVGVYDPSSGARLPVSPPVGDDRIILPVDD
ncbi:MAG TPA: hypothetical protein PLC06_15550 [Promineifilum sp.]|nr:hypothetical protein [Promineifilum sp.]